MIGASATMRPRRYTAADLKSRVRAIHRQSVALVNVGWICVIGAGLLNLIGVAAISTTNPREGLNHMVHATLGIFAAAAVTVPHYRHVRRFAYPLMGLVLVMLVFVLLRFVPESIVRPRNGARRWISLYVIDFQPSELAKIAYILSLACYLRFRENYRYFGGLLIPLLLTFIPMGLVLIEPDLGTAMLFLPTFFAMMIAAGAKLKHVFLIIMLGLSLAPIMYPMLEPHQKDRISALYYQMKGDPRFENDIGFQGARAMTLVGAGGVAGVGKEHAADLISYNRLPEEHNDMIFAVICCRWGMLGAVVTWMLFLLTSGAALLTAALCKDPFGRLVAVGVGAIIFAQMTINTGMTLGLIPITGMTLPFVSAGGTSLIATWLMVGLVLNIAMRRPQYLYRRSFEFDDGEEAE